MYTKEIVIGGLFTSRNKNYGRYLEDRHLSKSKEREEIILKKD